MESHRRKMGRPKNANLEPATARLATTKEALDKLDRMINYSRMPLGRKLESALSELEYLRKNRVGQQSINLPSANNSLLINNNSTNQVLQTTFKPEYDGNDISDEEEAKWFSDKKYPIITIESIEHMDEKLFSYLIDRMGIKR